MTERDVSRRRFLGGSAATIGGLAGVDPIAQAAAPGPQAEPVRTPDMVDIVLDVNGRRHSLTIEPRVTLLDALREDLHLTGTKKGCDRGSCGACTVHINGRRVLSCLTLALMAQDAEITTIEGLANGDEVHPVQAAFIRCDGCQCGYCTPGQIMSAVGRINEGHTRSDTEIQEFMSGNLCRCGAYPNIIEAIKMAAGQMKAGG